MGSVKDIVIIGTGGLGREVAALIESINLVQLQWNILGFFDDFEIKNEINGYPVLGKTDDLNYFSKEISVVFAIGNPKVKKSIYDKISNSKLNFPTLIHPSAQINSVKWVELGKGIVINANCVLTVNIKISDFVYVNSSVVLSHDVSVGNFSMLMPGVCISAGATIGNCVYLGNGVRIDTPVKIADESIVPMGTLLTNS